MIRYLAYFSIGGYKDILVGSTAESGDETGKLYYSSFLQPWLNGSLEINDEHTIQQLEQLKRKPQIEVLTAQSNYQMPALAKTLVTHGGYLMACCSLNGMGYSVAIRDLVSEVKDEIGRPIPFMMQFICDDVHEADALAYHFRKDLQATRDLLGSLFLFDPYLNCITFDLVKINKIVKSMLNEASETYAECRPAQRIVRMIVLSEGIALQYELGELGLHAHDVAIAYDAYGHLIADNRTHSDGDGTNKDSRRRYGHMEELCEDDFCDGTDQSEHQEGSDSRYMTARPSARQHQEEHYSGCFDIIVNWLKARFVLTKEDKEDLALMKILFKNIIKRHKK